MSTFLSRIGSYNTVLQMKNKTDGADLSTLMGVYLPCLQNIFGVILFIRMPWIVGQAGVVQACLIIAVCCLTTFLTSVSMSAIATNGVVPAGGSYFMISRTLGPQFGGSVGIIFFLGVSFAASMYIVGAIEILLNYLVPQIIIFDDIWHNMRLYGELMLILLTCIVAVGVKLVNKLATLFLACVILSILCIYVGILGSLGSVDVCEKSVEYNNETFSYLLKVGKDKLLLAECENETYGGHITTGLTNLLDFENFKSNIGPYYQGAGDIAPGVQVGDKDTQVYNDLATSFTILLAIFFPSVTGIMAGSNRSGDLKNAQGSIPKGTIAANLTTTVVYLVTAILCGAAATRQVLCDKYGESIDGGLVMSLIAFPHPYVVVFGCLLSTIGAALQCLIGAPRLLYAIAADDVIPVLKFFSVTLENGEPFRALIATFCIASIGCAIGNVDLVAPIITMFFLVCYSCVNLACTLQSLLQAPNWRPRFTLYHWATSLLGLIMCLTLMFISNWIYAIVALSIAVGIYKYIDFKGAEKEWGDGIRGLQLQAAKYSLLSADRESLHIKNWRPQLLALLSYKETLTEDNQGLLSFSRSLKHGNGLVIVGTVVPYDLIKLLDDNDVLEKQRSLLEQGLKEHKLAGFIQVTCEESIPKGTTTLLQTAGLGGLKPNTILMGWPENWKTKNSFENFSRVVRCATVLRQSVLVARGSFPQRKQKLAGGTIDVWWVVHDGGMMLLIAHLIKQHKTWRKCRLRIFTVAQLEDDSVKMRNDLKNILYELRIDATVQVIEMSNKDISAYTYERTVNMAERNKMMEYMGLTKRQKKRTLSFVVESAHTPGTSGIELDPALMEAEEVLNEMETATQQHEAGPAIVEPEEEQDKLTVRRSQLKTDQLLAMDTSVKLNGLVREHSSEAVLVLMNMPPPVTPFVDSMTDQNYVEYLDVLTEGLNRVLLVRGSGTEVVTVYS
ncbi:solute carrier family 12 member 6-like isoform X3 [Bolinopsis microptera]|uniref:solute carrier family 12 member 6-like isoform X3 n=1 Tax=Bolinopsis microptera TaxID=2820187 RepID=UPI003078D58A